MPNLSAIFGREQPNPKPKTYQLSKSLVQKQPERTNCQNIKQDLKLSDRWFNYTECETNLPRDFNASIIKANLKDSENLG